MGKSKKEDSSTAAMDIAIDKPKLQAVILADSFLNTFQPLSLDVPKVLCPLNNVALLDYAMDSLAGNGVENVFVVCTRDELELHLETTSQPLWQGRMNIECIKDTSLTNAGDALRELYKRNVIQSDPFLLLFGDVITNMDLTQALQAHLERHKQDSAAIMTLVLNPAGGTSDGGNPCPIQSATNDLVIGLDPAQDNRVLLYDNQASKQSVSLPCSFFAAHTSMEVRTDFLDTGVYICSPDVLGRFEDEFDYLDISMDFVHNSVAEEEEGLQTRIHAHILPPHEYAARIVDWKSYHAVSHDLLRRWCYPIVADNNLHATPQLYKPTSTSTINNNKKKKIKNHNPTTAGAGAGAGSNYHQYKETLKPCKVARSAIIQGPGMLGSNTSVQENAIVSSTVVGCNVTIGNSVVLQDSHLWDDVIVESGAKVTQAILAKGCIVRKNAIISKGCIIGQGCIIGEGVVLPEYTRITLQEEDDDPFADVDSNNVNGNDSTGFDDDWNDEDDDGNAIPSTTNDKVTAAGTAPGLIAETESMVVGKDGKGRVWQPLLDDDEDDDDDDDSDDDNDLGQPATTTITPIQLQSIGTNLDAYYQQRLQRQAEPAEDGFSEGGVDDESQRMETEAFAAFTDGTFTFEDTPAASSTDAPLVYGRQKGVDVVKELKEICMEFDDSAGAPIENLAIELNSYKFSQNATYSDCTMASMLAILDKLHITSDLSDGKLVSAFKQKLEFWSPLLQKMSIGQAEEIAIIGGLERAATSDETAEVSKKLRSGRCFRFLLQTLHDQDILSEESILAWAEERKSESTDSALGKIFRLQSIQDFLEWLQEEEEEDDDDDEDEDDSNASDDEE